MPAYPERANRVWRVGGSGSQFYRKPRCAPLPVVTSPRRADVRRDQ